MNNLLSKEHYCYKVHTLLMKSIAYPLPPFYRQPPYMDSPPHFYKKTFTLCFVSEKLDLSFEFLKFH